MSVSNFEQEILRVTLDFYDIITQSCTLTPSLAALLLSRMKIYLSQLGKVYRIMMYSLSVVKPKVRILENSLVKQ